MCFELVDECYCGMMLRTLFAFFPGFSLNVVHEQQHVDTTLLRSNTVVWFFSLIHIVSLCPLWISSSSCLVSFLFWTIWIFVWRLSYMLPFVLLPLNSSGTLRLIGAFCAFFYDPNTIVYCSLLFCLFMYQTLWGHPSFRLSHDQLDSPLQNQRALIFRGRLISKAKW